MKPIKLPKLSEQTAAYKLYHYPYLWLFPANAGYNANHTEFFGMHTSGDADVDLARSSMPSEQYITTDIAAELHSKGVALSISNPQDAVVVYKLIVEHLEDWLKYLETVRGFSRKRTVPLKGLKEYNDLATILVPVARRFGLVDQLDLYKNNRSRRRMSSFYEAPTDVSKAVHSHYTYNAIAALANAQNKKMR